jgi:hypothetical protein
MENGLQAQPLLEGSSPSPAETRRNEDNDMTQIRAGKKEADSEFVPEEISSS